MKITMLTTMCGPDGNADPGAVLDLPEAQANLLLGKEKDDKGKWVDTGVAFARLFDAEKDKRPRHIGLRKYVRGVNN